MGSLFDALYPEEEEEELTPSQRARKEAKAKGIFDALYPEPEPAPPKPEEEPGLFEKAKGVVGKIAKGVKEFLFEREERPIAEEVGMPKDQYINIVGNVYKDKIDTERQLEETRKELQNLQLKLPKFRQIGADKEEARLDREVFALQETVKDYENFISREPARRGLLQQALASIKDPGKLLNLNQIKETEISVRETEVMKKYEAGQELTDEEMIYFNRFRARTLDSYIKRGVGAMVSDAVTNMSYYIMEIAVMSNMAGEPGAYTNLATGFSNTIKLTSPVARELVEKVLDNSVRKAVASRLDIPGIGAKTAEYMLPAYEIQMGVDGQDFLKLVKPGFDREASVSKAYASNLVGYVSESVGDYVDDALPFVKKLFISKWLDNKGITSPRIATKLLRKMSFNSIVSEVLEEEIAEPIQAIIDEREYKDPFFTPEGRERLLVETLGITMFSGLAKVSDITQNALTKRRQTVPGDMFTLRVEAEIPEKPVKLPEEPKKPISPEVPPVVAEEVEIPKALEPLAQEARKYGSAEEFYQYLEKWEGTNKILEGGFKGSITDFYDQATKEVEEPKKIMVGGREVIEPVNDSWKLTPEKAQERLGEVNMDLYQRSLQEAVALDLPANREGLKRYAERGLDWATEALKEAPAVVEKPIPKELESMAERAKKAKSEADFVSDEIFTRSIPGTIQAIIEKDYEGKTIADKLESFYLQATRVAKPTVEAKPPAELEPLAKEVQKYKSTDELPEIGEEIVDRDGRPWIITEVLSETRFKATPKGGIVTQVERKIIDGKLMMKDIDGKWTDIVGYTFDTGKRPPTVKEPAPPKPELVKKPVVKPKQLELKEVEKPKAKIFKAEEKKRTQKETREAVFTGKDPQERVRSISKYVTDLFNQADDPLYERKLKTVRAELKRDMYEMVGVDTGDWKRDYAYFQVARNNIEISDIVDEIEDSIFRIDETIGPKEIPKTTGYATTQAKPISEFEERKSPKKETAEFKLFEETKALTKKYARLIGEGYTPRNALGVYYSPTKNIMVDAMNNLSVVAHEVTHFLDATYKISDKLLAIKGFAVNGNPIYDPGTLKYRRAITDLYVKYYGGGRTTHKLRKRALEGFATLLQKYVESPQTITNEYPLLVDGFLKEGGEYYQPVMKEIIKDLNKIVEKYQGLSSLDKIGSRITSENVSADKTDFLNFFEKLRTQLVDAIYPVEVLAKQAKVHFTVDDPSLWLRSYNSVSGIVNNNIATDRGYWTLKDDAFVKKYDFNWKSLVDMAEERKVTNDFAYYLVARREHFSYQEIDVLKEKFDLLKEEYGKMKAKDKTLVDEEGRTPKDKLIEIKDKYVELKTILDNDGFSREEVDGAYGENKMRFKKEEQLFDALTKADLEFLASENVQLVTPKQLEELSSRQGYASFKRQFYNELLGDYNEMPAQARVGKTKISSLLRRKGSMKTIINPLYSGIANHSEVMRKGLQQVVYNKITTIGVSAAFPNIFQELDLRVAVDKETGAFHYPQEKDPNIIMGRVDYKRKPVLIDKQVKDIIDDILTYRNIGVFEKLYAGLSRMFTAGTTGFYPQFAATNFIRDQITAQANTTNKYKTLFSPLAEFGKMLANKNSESYQYYQEYLVMGGERHTFTGWQRLAPEELFKRINGEKKGLTKAIHLMDKGTDILSIPSKYSEIVTRASEYINARRDGKPQIVALEEAGRLTAPFHHFGKWGGQWGKTFIRGLPFFNATLQVIDQSIRTAETKGGRKRMSFVTLAITAAYLTALMSLLRADDEQKEQYKDLEAKELTTNLYFPHPSGRKLIRIPMSDIFSSLGAIINMIIADNVLRTKYKASDYIAAATSVIPDQFNLTEPVNAFLSWVPQVFQAGTETVMGVKTWPKVAPLESMALKNMPPAMRTNENTSMFAKWLGKKINISPIRIDYLLTGYFGRSIGYATGKPSALDFQSSIIRDYYFSYGRRVSGMYDLRETNDQNYTVYQRGEKELSASEVEELYRVKMLTDDFADVMRDYRKVDIEEDQEEAALLRAEALTIISDIDSKKKPKGFNTWVKGAEKRRKEKIKELEKEASIPPSKTVGKILADLVSKIHIVKPAYAAEREHYRLDPLGVDTVEDISFIKSVKGWLKGIYQPAQVYAPEERMRSDKPYSLRMLKNGLIRLDYQNGAYSDIKESDLPEYLAGWQKLYPEITGKEWTGLDYQKMLGNKKTKTAQRPIVEIAKAFIGLDQVEPKEEYAKTVTSSSKKNNVNSSLVAAMLWQESGYEPDAVNTQDIYNKEGVLLMKDARDRGIAQINEYWHPEVSDEQAYDPEWSIKWLTKELASLIKYFDGDISMAVAAYNVGRSGVKSNLGQDTPFGGGPKGQEYIDNVTRNLTKELREELGLKTSY